MVYNAPNLAKHSFQINGVEKGRINSNGLQLDNININNHYIMTQNGGNSSAITAVDGCGICAGTGDGATFLILILELCHGMV